MSARRRPRCNARMRFPPTHVYTHIHVYTDLRDCYTLAFLSSFYLLVRVPVFVQLCNENAGDFYHPVSFAIQPFPPTIYDRNFFDCFHSKEKKIAFCHFPPVFVDLYILILISDFPRIEYEYIRYIYISNCYLLSTSLFIISWIENRGD